MIETQVSQTNDLALELTLTTSNLDSVFGIEMLTNVVRRPLLWNHCCRGICRDRSKKRQVERLGGKPYRLCVTSVATNYILETFFPLEE